MNSSAMFQLNPSIPVVTPDGKGEAMGWIDYGKEDNLLCFPTKERRVLDLSEPANPCVSECDGGDGWQIFPRKN
jgi:hypothetical protein